MPKLHSLEERIVKNVKWANEPVLPNSNFNKNPYQQVSEPVYNFDVGPNDKILVQVDLGGAILTLTIFSLIIVDNDKKTYQYDLFDDYLNLSIQELNRALIPGASEESVSFYIRDRITNKVLQVASSTMCSSSYVTQEEIKANYLDLVIRRATYLLGEYIQMSIFNANLSLLSAYLDMIDTNTGSGQSGKEINPANSDMNDVEFLD
jgi:hypothetical protein